jgi:hypothetical protein
MMNLFFMSLEIAGPLLAFGRMLMFKIGGVSFKREIGINGYLTNLSGVIGSKDKVSWTLKFGIILDKIWFARSSFIFLRSN